MKKIILRLLLIVIIIVVLSIGGYCAYNYYLDIQNKEVEDTFYSYVFKNNFKNIFDFDIEENIITKMNTDDYVSKIKFDFSIEKTLWSSK